MDPGMPLDSKILNLILSCKKSLARGEIKKHGAKFRYLLPHGCPFDTALIYFLTDYFLHFPVLIHFLFDIPPCVMYGFPYENYSKYQ